jgi:hypothetical protein
MRPVLPRTYTIEPVIARHEVAARIPNDGNFESPYFLHYVLTEPIRVGQLRTGIIDALVDRASELLKKRSE